VLLTCGAFTAEGEFLELPELDLERLQTAWQEAVFALYLAEDKIEPEVVENMRSCFPDPQDDELARGTQRNFQILDPLEFLAEFTQHIPPKGAHLIRGHRPKVGRGWYSNKAREMRRKAAEAAAAALEPAAASSSGDAGPALARSRLSQTWAMLIKRLYELCEAQRNTRSTRWPVLSAAVR
jgi:hypothetical protein